MSVDEAQVKSQMGTLREWLKTVPHIPYIDDLMLRRFLHSCYYDIPATKKCIELFHSIRATCPRVFDNRDPLSNEMKKVFSYANAVFLTNGKDNVRIWQLNDPGMNNYDHADTSKAFMMMADVSFIEEKHMPERDIVILDLKDISLKFLTKVNLSIMRTTAQYLQGALPVRLKQVHVLNAPSYMDKLFAVVKPFVQEEVIQMIHFHKPNTETVFQHLDRDVMPKDYGGEMPSMNELMASWVKRLENQRDFLCDDTKWRSTDAKKNGDPCNGTFKSLAID